MVLGQLGEQFSLQWERRKITDDLALKRPASVAQAFPRNLGALFCKELSSSELGAPRYVLG